MSWKKRLFTIIHSLFFVSGLVIFLGMLIGIYIVGYYHGALTKQTGLVSSYNNYDLTDFANKFVSFANVVIPQPTLVPQDTLIPSTNNSNGIWGGPDLWVSVNARRKELGLRELVLDDELCTIASIRLNDQLAIKTLDGHEGFNTMTQKRPDLVSIFNKYSNMSEFLAFGGQTPEQTVEMWENSLGHQKLLTSPDYIYGCIYAQDTYAVAITAF